MTEIDFRDIDTLRGAISDDYGEWSGDFLISQELINQFAELSGDSQWIHVDPERAKLESPFGCTIAHGFLLLAIMPQVRPPQNFTVKGHTSVVNYGSSGLRFLDPVPSGSYIRSRQKLFDVEAKKSGTLLTFEVAFQVKSMDRPSLIYNMALLYR
ncbi:MaoC family dehydratase [Parahaliea mediterranea]|uniref:MaoC family dehydratase n=1 Tax=Parahaliea mediterranea TaxID=651086 RepID=A0A939DEU0_9GAMM|nr:MaoC family dehydratase [Parahaliea mediterranea]MBN7796928.1 MaoC family dehydratase [Parahaliea mediterranea]